MRYLSVCSGIEAASVAWHGLMEPAAFSEIEPFPSAVLAARFPGVPNLGDMNNFRSWDLGAIDVLVGGTPCQSFSVAGLRKGLADPRGNLALVYCGILERFKPKFFVWENVPGVLSSSGGRDFGAFLGAVAQLGYGFAYRILDAAYCGVPQRRRRVFVVGCLGDWRRAAEVLFEREGVCGNSKTSSSKKQDVAGTLSSRTSGGGGLGTDFDLAGGLQVSHCLNAKGGNGRIDAESETFVACTLPASDGGVSSGMHPVVAFTQNSRDEVRMIGGDGQTTGALAATSGMKQTNYLAFNAVGVTIHGTDKTQKIASYTETAGSLRTKPPGSQENSSTTAVMQNMAVRRLTPRECERLQGFPDDFTLIPYRGKLAADGPRYKAIGNSMAVPCMRWIGKRLVET